MAPLLVQDYKLMEQKPNAAAAHGAFTVTHGIAHWTKASLFSHAGKKTECLARFSTPGAERTPLGFDLRFFTEEGDWDLVGTSIPVHFVRDPSIEPPPRVRDFWPLSPESLHYITLLFSDRGAPSSYHQINGYPRQTFRLINANNEPVWCKFHCKTMQGATSLTRAHAGNSLPKWCLAAQIMTEAEAATLEYNPFNLTKIWPQSRFPLHEVGILELNRAAEAAQEDFDPAKLVPGISRPPAQATPAGSSDNDDYSQPGNLFRLMIAAERERLIFNLVAAMQGVPEPILLRQICQFFLCDPAYGKLIADGLGLSLDQALAPELVRPKTAIG